MSEWWTYRLGSFLLFSPRTYYRLFELYNEAVWPGQLLALALGLGLVALVARGGPARSRGIGAVLAGCWLWSGVAFLALRYARINFAATYFAWAFAAEAALLLGTAVVRGRVAFERPIDRAGRAGLAILLISVAVLPLLAPALGRGWRSAEIFGLAPDPTAVGTLGALLASRGRPRWLLTVVPLLWCLVTGITLLAMKAPDFWVAPLAAALSVTLAAWQRRASIGDPRRETLALD
jgi:hypothetical protein